MIQAKALLLSKQIIASDVHLLYFYIAGEGMSFNPGQYIIINIPSSPSPLKRLYSFAGTNIDKNTFELLIRLVPQGAASEYIKDLVIGDEIEVTGPAGLFSEQKTPNRKIYMTTGTGFAPIRSFLLSRQNESINGDLYWGLRDLNETCLIEELLAIKQSSPLFSFCYCLSQQSSFGSIPADLLHYYRVGHIDTVWEEDGADIKPTDEYYLCGSRTVIESLRLLLLSKGVSKDKLFFEKY